MLNKNTKDLYERMLEKKLDHTSGYQGCDEKFCLMIRKQVYPNKYTEEKNLHRKMYFTAS